LGESVIIPTRGATPPDRVSGGSPAADQPARPANSAETERPAAHAAPYQAGRVGVIGGLVRAVFRVFEVLIFVLLLPVRVVSLTLGQGLMFVLKLPIRVLAVLIRVFGYLLIIALLVGLATVFLAWIVA
jgi:hypothetical protein